MSLNWREIDLILEELALPGAFIQKILQPDFTSLLLSLYRPGDPFDLLIVLAPGKTRLHRTAWKGPRPETLQRFAQFLRARCGGARIAEARQVGEDRIVKLVAVSGDVETILWIRLWSGAANIIATDVEGRILDAFYRRPGRGEVSGGHFDPEEAAPEGAARPRGIAARPAVDEAGASAPGAPHREGAMSERRPKAGYEVRALPGEGSFNERVERYYMGEDGGEEIERLRERALKALDQRMSAISSSLETLELKRKNYENPERFKQIGDLILANIHLIRPGAAWLSVENFYENNERTEIELDGTKSAQENAERYYARFKKAKSGLVRLDEEANELRAARDRIAHEREEVERSTDVARLAGRWKAAVHRAQTPKEARPGLEFSSEGFTILVGRSAKENDELLRRHVRGNDLWLHARDYPGAYVFIKQIPGKSVPLEVLLDAGNLAVHYSRAKGSGQAELYYTHVKYLRRPREGKLGLVLPTQEKNLSVRIEAKRIERLFAERDSPA